MVLLEVIISISFIYFLASTLVSGINEIIVMLMNKRGKELKESIRLLMDEDGSEWSDKFYAHPIISSLREPARWVSVRALKQRIIKFFYRDNSKIIFNPSYIPASHFTEVITDFLTSRYIGGSDETFNKRILHAELKYISDMREYLGKVDEFNFTRFKTLFVDSEDTSHPVQNDLKVALEAQADHNDLGTFVRLVNDTITSYIKNAPTISSAEDQMKFIAQQMDNPGKSDTTKVLYGLIQNSKTLEELKHKVNVWYDDYMDRVSGWYKRKVKFALLWISVVLVFSMNIDAIAITKELFTNVTLREAMVSAAEDYSEANTIEVPDGEQPDSADLKKIIEAFKTQLNQFNNYDLPIGWSNVTDDADCKCTRLKSVWKELKKGNKFLGLLLSILAISMGAPFWFDVLNKFIRVRKTIPVPTPKKEEPNGTSDL